MARPETGHLLVPMHGRLVEVPRAALAAELERDGPIASLALVEAIVRAAPRDQAIERLGRALGEARGTSTLASILGLVRLEAREAKLLLLDAAARLGPPLEASARAAAHFVDDSLGALAALVETDDVLAQRTPLVFASAHRHPDGGLLVAALLRALDRLQPTLGITAYRALLGDVAEAIFRALQHGAASETLLGAGGGALVDRLAAELPGTPDLVAARGMTWLLGAIAPSDDAVRSAIERARARFRDPAFHRDCAAILGEEPALKWPPPPLDNP